MLKSYGPEPKSNEVISRASQVRWLHTNATPVFDATVNAIAHDFDFVSRALPEDARTIVYPMPGDEQSAEIEAVEAHTLHTKIAGEVGIPFATIFKAPSGSPPFEEERIKAALDAEPRTTIGVSTDPDSTRDDQRLGSISIFAAGQKILSAIVGAKVAVSGVDESGRAKVAAFDASTGVGLGRETHRELEVAQQTRRRRALDQEARNIQATQAAELRRAQETTAELMAGRTRYQQSIEQLRDGVRESNATFDLAYRKIRALQTNRAPAENAAPGKA